MSIIKSFMSSASEENYNRIFRKKEMDEIAENITAMAEQQAEQEEQQLTNEC